MSTPTPKVTRTDILEVKVDQLQEDVVEIRRDIKKINHRLDNMDESLNKKLDKILDVVSEKQGSVNSRLTKLEHHTAHPPVAITF